MQKDTDIQQDYDDLLRMELLGMEKRSQQITGWLLAVTIIFLNIIVQFQSGGKETPFLMFTLVLSVVLVIWFAGTAFFINKGYYHQVFKYLNLILQVSTVTFFLMVNARLVDADAALSSTAPLFYLLVIGLTSMTLNPMLSLLAGGFAAGQFVGAYAFWLKYESFHSIYETDQELWTQIILKAIIFLMMGISAMVIARRSRALLERMVSQVCYEEQIRFIEQDMSQAAEIQENLIPRSSIQSEYFDVETFYSPAKQVGGDYYDIIKHPDNTCVVLIADVAGKGYSAALLMSNIQAIVRTLVNRGITLDELVDTLNQTMCTTSVRGGFLSLFCMKLDPENNKLTYINCGHNPPLLRIPGKELEELKSTGPVLGVISEYPVVHETCDLPSGATVFAYTDGLSELRSARGEQMGVEGIKELLESVRFENSSQLKDRVLHLVYEHLQDSEPADDLSFICIRNK